MKKPVRSTQIEGLVQENHGHSYRELHTVLDSLREAVFTVGEDGSIRLVNEAVGRLLDADVLHHAPNRRYLFGAVTRAMRHILVDHARKRRHRGRHEVRLREPLDDVVDHVEHIIKLVGVDHVGLGSDFDGVGDSLPEGLKDVSQYPALFQALLDRGHSPEDVEKIASGNVFRVWSAVIGS